MNRQLFSLRVSMFDAPPSPFKLTVEVEFLRQHFFTPLDDTVFHLCNVIK